MWNAFAISTSGLAASAANLSKAASRVACAFTGGPAPEVPQTQPASAASPAAAPAAPPLAGSSAVAAQQRDEPASWMVEILQAQTAYKANLAVLKTSEEIANKTIDMIG